MSLRLLPAITMDNDEDDDGNFTKWMSSYWGHGAEARNARDRKRSFRRPSRMHSDRRASLPSASQLDAMKLNRLHAATMAPAPIHTKSREEKGEVRPHQRARRGSSDDSSCSKSAIPENRISTIPELAEFFEKRLCLCDKRPVSLNDYKLCLICHENLRKNGAGVEELHCTHCFHKEVARRLEQGRPRSNSEAEACPVRRLLAERRKSADGPICREKDQNTPHPQLSLKKQH
ncbi:leukemia NUP98 fusion partner 1 [Thalassophryne amazonica]|uniref:leukemia NUP98 fusion partner 1 n=1 Tax=Thalassophryne amazonica TaxID=390379 RepID=UPI0014718903|nr:leukemia NUP98 fusion partner 1 [Thalassophryne amazonica]